MVLQRYRFAGLYVFAVHGFGGLVYGTGLLAVAVHGIDLLVYGTYGRHLVI